jgi:MraZ protein
MEKYDQTNQGTIDYTRMVMGSAEDELEFDPQGRVVVPRKLRDAAKLKDKLLLVGCNSRLEVWAEDEFARYEQDRDGYCRERREKMQRAYKEMRAS